MVTVELKDDVLEIPFGVVDHFGRVVRNVQP